MEKLVTGLLAQLSPDAGNPLTKKDQLDRIIRRLEGQKRDLERRLDRESNGSKQRQLKTAIKAAHLQHKKAVALRVDFQEAEAEIPTDR